MMLLELSRGYETAVDDQDYEVLRHFSWFTRVAHKGSGLVYAVRCDSRRSPKIIQMHREIMCPPEGAEVDHRDGDTLNNCRSNLRIVTTQQNARNKRAKRGASSRFKGVSYDRKLNNWRVRISDGIKNRSLGWYQDEIEAARVYNAAAVELFGEFARVNQISAAQ